MQIRLQQMRPYHSIYSDTFGDVMGPSHAVDSVLRHKAYMSEPALVAAETAPVMPVSSSASSSIPATASQLLSSDHPLVFLCSGDRPPFCKCQFGVLIERACVLVCDNDWHLTSSAGDK